MRNDMADDMADQDTGNRDLLCKSQWLNSCVDAINGRWYVSTNLKNRRPT